MIGWFPTPYPDELFYSICARFQELAAYSSPRWVNEDLFGNSQITSVIDLPCHLGHLVSALPPGHHITVDRLIDDHTLLPFCSPFLPADRIKRLRDVMRYGDGKNVHKLAGMNRNSGRIPNRLRFCPTCVKEDRTRFGLTYWHRIHQLPGVEVCAVHAVFLEKSQVRALNRPDKYSYIPAECAVVDVQPRPLDLANPTHAAQLSAARDAKWLLLHGGTVPSDPVGLRTRYLTLLSERGLAIMSGYVRIGNLMSAIKGHFTPDLLRVLQSDFDEHNNLSWPAELIGHLLRGRSHHPLRHLIMMQFLLHEVDAFFKLPVTYLPFGKGPWPCLNPTCLHFGRRTLYDIQVRYRKVGERGSLPVATFKCNLCGFVYNRVGPDEKQAGLNRINRTVEYGPVWEGALRKYWSNPELSLDEIAKKLRVSDQKQIKREAGRIGLLFPRSGPGNKASEKNKQGPQLSNSKIPSKDDVLRNRQEWLLARKRNPKFSRTALRVHFSSLYSWLSRYDSRWFSTHLPPPRKTGGWIRTIDWHARDIELARAVKRAARLLKSASGKPKKITN